MLSRKILVFVFCGVFMSACANQKSIKGEQSKTMMLVPMAEKIPYKMKKHGDLRIDNYYWLREKTNEKVLNHLRAENSYTEEMMKDTKTLQGELYKEMRYRIKEDDQSVPYKKGSYFYYTKTLKGQEYPLYCRKKGSENALEEIMIDVNILGKGRDFIKVTPPNVHPNEQIMAYAVDTKGDRIYTIFFKDLKNNKILDQTIENVTANMAWAEKGKILFFAKQDPQTLRSNKIFRYDLETGITEEIYEEKDEKFSAYIYKTLSRNFLIIGASSTLSSEQRYIPADEPYAKWQVFLPREKNHEYSITDGEDRFYIRTNWKAKNFRLMEVNLKNTEKKYWKNILPHRKDVFVEDFDVFKKHITVSERKGGLTQILVLKRGRIRGDYIKFPEPAYMVSMGQNAEYDTDFVRYEFESMNRPSSVFDYDIAKKISTLKKEKEVPGYVSSNYISERIFATAKDGTKIPISLVYKKRFQKNSSAPILLYGYGSYGMSMDPWFSSGMVSLLDRGFVFAMAHVRGGSEMGREWYESGKFLKKKNTFTDFITATEYLVEKKYADAKKVYAMGGSAGGMLMGAVMNLRPELYHGIVAQVPFVDIVTTMLDSSLPLTTGEYEEWGNPNDPKYYKYMKSYSPYDNVTAKDYPNILVTTGLNDSQVAYWEPAKWVAKLREMRTNPSKLLLMKIEMEVGHGGKSGRFEYLKEKALEYAFLLKLEGIRF